MDARTAESAVTLQQESWLQRERASGRFYDRLAALLALFVVAMIGLSVWLLRREAEAGITTAEYAVGTAAGAGLAGLLYKMLSGGFGERLLKTLFDHVLGLLGLG